MSRDTVIRTALEIDGPLDLSSSKLHGCRDQELCAALNVIASNGFADDSFAKEGTYYALIDQFIFHEDSLGFMDAHTLANTEVARETFDGMDEEVAA